MKVIKSKLDDGFVKGITTDGNGQVLGVVLVKYATDAQHFSDQEAEAYLQTELTILADANGFDVKENFAIYNLELAIVNPATY